MAERPETQKLSPDDDVCRVYNGKTNKTECGRFIPEGWCCSPPEYPLCGRPRCPACIAVLQEHGEPWPV